MTEHDMGRQDPSAPPVAPGLYRADQMVLGMGGTWQAEVVVTRPGRPTVRVPFTFTVPAVYRTRRRPYTVAFLRFRLREVTRPALPT